MELNDWILSLHLLSAFALVGALTIFSIVIVATWRSDDPREIAAYMRISKLGTILIGVGVVGTVVFGVWLAVSVDGYALWDGWVIAALVLWAVATELGRRGGAAYAKAGARAEELAASGTTTSAELAEVFGASRALWLHVGSTVITVLVLVDMIWKPGA
jgi:uncharacterized membrane protein